MKNLKKRTPLREKVFYIYIFGVSIFFIVFLLALIIADAGWLGKFMSTSSPSQFHFFKEALFSKNTLYSIRLSFITTTISTIFAIIAGVPIAYFLSRFKFPGSSVIDTLIDMPIMLPPIVMGLSLLVLLATPFGRGLEKIGIYFVFAIPGIVLAQFMATCSFAIRTIKPAFDTLSRRYEDVALTLGYTRSEAFFKTTLPLSKNSILAAAVVCWARAMGEFGPILVLVGYIERYTAIMPTLIYMENHVGRMEVSLAISLFMIVIGLATLFIFRKLGGGIKFS